MPINLRPTELTVHGLCNALLKAVNDPQFAWFDGTPHEVSFPKKWISRVGLPKQGSFTLQQSESLENMKTSLSDFVKFVIDASMTDVAKIWDDTFIEGGFTHCISKQGEALKCCGGDDVTLNGKKANEVAKIMRWVFAVPPLAKREVISIYVLHQDEYRTTCMYFPIKNDLVFSPPRFYNMTVRGRLMVPCFDSGLFDEQGKMKLTHSACADMSGWLPNFFLTGAFGQKANLKHSESECEELLELLQSQGKQGDRFSKIARRDGTKL